MLKNIRKEFLKNLKIGAREGKSLCPKEFQQRDIERDELLIRYHNLATIVNKYKLLYNDT